MVRPPTQTAIRTSIAQSASTEINADNTKLEFSLCRWYDQICDQTDTWDDILLRIEETRSFLAQIKDDKDSDVEQAEEKIQKLATKILCTTNFLKIPAGSPSNNLRSKCLGFLCPADCREANILTSWGVAFSPNMAIILSIKIMFGQIENLFSKLSLLKQSPTAFNNAFAPRRPGTFDSVLQGL